MRQLALLLGAMVLLPAGCAAPDARALKKLACEQAAASVDIGSISQLDALRKALGVAPGVDPIAECRALGARMESSGTNDPAIPREEGGGEAEERRPE